MALTTLMSGMFWGMTRAVVQTTMHFQSLDWNVAWGPAVWEVWYLGHLGKKRYAWWIHFFFCFEGLMIDFSSHGEDTHFYIGTDGDLFQIAAHGDSLYLMNLVTDRYTMNVLITTLFFEEGFHFFQFSS